MGSIKLHAKKHPLYSTLDHSHISSGASFPGTPSDGDIYYHTTKKMLFCYDGGRTKWLSITRDAYTLGRSPVTGDSNASLRIGTAHTSSASGIHLPRDGTIVAATVKNENSVTRDIQIKINNSTVSTVSLTAVSEATDDAINQDFSAADELQVYAKVAAGEDMTNLIVMVEVAWR